MTLEQELSDVKKNLVDALPEAQQRVTRVAAIPNELVVAQSALKEIESQLSSLTPDDDQTMVFQSRVTLFRARRQKQLAIISELVNERDAYTSQGALPRLRIDLLTARSKQLEKDIDRDTLYSFGMFDLRSPVTIMLPETKGRYQSLMIVSQDRSISAAYGPRTVTLTEENVGTRYVFLAVPRRHGCHGPNGSRCCLIRSSCTGFSRIRIVPH